MHFVDAHHHFWDLDHCHYPWLMARGVRRFFGDPTPIQQNYLPEHLLAESARWRPAKSVHVQVGAAEEHSLRESEWLQSLADQAGPEGHPNAIVAFADLTRPDLESELQRQSAVANVRAVRHILGRHVDEDRASGADQLIHNPRLRQGLARLPEWDLSFDLQMIPAQHAAVFELLADIPGLRFAICHAGSPWDQSPEGMYHWREGMRRFASLQNAWCKISGLGMFKPDWRLDDIRPIFDTVIELFGVERVMLGSNFPVDRLYTSYERIWDAYDLLSSGLTESQRRRLFAGTAEEYYRI